MALQPNGPAPYTTGVSMISALEVWRKRGLGKPISSEVLVRAGINESIARRTFQSMETLGLVDADGVPEAQFEDFRKTRGDDEYKARLQEWLRTTYADVLQYADPTTDSLDRVAEAFRTYLPEGQRKSMASLLIALWRYAGLPVAEGDAARRTVTVARRLPTKGALTVSKKTPVVVPPTGVADLPPGLVGLLHQIPKAGQTWTDQRRKEFMQAFEAVLNFTIPVDNSPRPAGTEEAEM